MSETDVPAWLDEVPTNPLQINNPVARPQNLAHPRAPQRVQSPAGSSEDDKRLMETLRNSLYPGASWESLAMVLAWCRVNKVDPFLKCIHIVPMNVKIAGTRNYEWRDVLMPSITDYRLKADRSGVYLGKSEPFFGPIVEYDLSGQIVNVPEWCKITIRKLVKGHVAEFSAIEYWMENYATAGRDSQKPNAMWAKRSRGQLCKCTEAQALRMAFPELTGGGPTSEEMEGKPFALIDAEPYVPSLEAPGAKLEEFNKQFATPEVDPLAPPIGLATAAHMPKAPEPPATGPTTDAIKDWAATVIKTVGDIKTVEALDSYVADHPAIKNRLAWLSENHPDIGSEIMDAIADRRGFLHQLPKKESSS